MSPCFFVLAERVPKWSRWVGLSHITFGTRFNEGLSTMWAFIVRLDTVNQPRESRKKGVEEVPALLHSFSPRCGCDAVNSPARPLAIVSFMGDLSTWSSRFVKWLGVRPEGRGLSRGLPVLTAHDLHAPCDGKCHLLSAYCYYELIMTPYTVN